MKIKEVSRVTGISKRNIHYYIGEGLITPQTDKENGYYIFGEDECKRLEIIRILRNAHFPISEIRSILDTPATSDYYLRIHQKRVLQNIRYSQMIVDSLEYVLCDLPFKTSFDELHKIVCNAGFPKETGAFFLEGEDQFDSHIVNNYLWRIFLPLDHMSEYQKYLWDKINRITNENPSEEYRRLYKYLKSLDSRQIDGIFSMKYEKIKEIAVLSESECEEYALTMRTLIKSFLSNPGAVQTWNHLYGDMIDPETKIYTSEIIDLVSELSPLFKEYYEKINHCNLLLYQYLHSDEGKPLLTQMRETLIDNMNIDECNHGELEAMASFCDIL